MASPPSWLTVVPLGGRPPRPGDLEEIRRWIREQESVLRADCDHWPDRAPGIERQLEAWQLSSTSEQRQAVLAVLRRVLVEVPLRRLFHRDMRVSPEQLYPPPPARPFAALSHVEFTDELTPFHDTDASTGPKYAPRRRLTTYGVYNAINDLVLLPSLAVLSPRGMMSILSRGEVPYMLPELNHELVHRDQFRVRAQRRHPWPLVLALAGLAAWWLPVWAWPTVAAIGLVALGSVSASWIGLLPELQARIEEWLVRFPRLHQEDGPTLLESREFLGSFDFLVGQWGAPGPYHLRLLLSGRRARRHLRRTAQAIVHLRLLGWEPSSIFAQFLARPYPWQWVGGRLERLVELELQALRWTPDDLKACEVRLLLWRKAIRVFVATASREAIRGGDPRPTDESDSI